MSQPITIVGGGLSGLTLGIGLRQLDVPVTIWEAGNYPRHRVCGEFISGRGQETLARLGLLPLLQGNNARAASSVTFFEGKKSTPVFALPQSALCLSRFVLDELLAREFQRLGGELHTGRRWSDNFASGVVRATGRSIKPVANGWRYFGLKVHARGASLAADLEMHFVPAGYVGLCRLPNGETNICGLFRSRTPVPDLAKCRRDWLAGVPGSTLHARLAGMELDEGSFCSVAGLSLRPRRAADSDECCIGDSLSMIPPITGNGMSMAFESAELAVEPLAEFHRGALTWPQTRQKIARAVDQMFARRLRAAAWMQHALFESPARAFLFLAGRASWPLAVLFKCTR